MTREERRERIIEARTALYAWRYILARNPKDPAAFAGVLEALEELAKLKHFESEIHRMRKKK